MLSFHPVTQDVSSFKLNGYSQWERKIFPIKSYLFNIVNPSLSSSNKGNKHKAFFIFWKILSWLLTPRLYLDVTRHSWDVWSSRASSDCQERERERERERESFILSQIWPIIHHPQYYILSAKWANKSEVSYIYIQIAILSSGSSKEKEKVFHFLIRYQIVEATVQCSILNILNILLHYFNGM